MSGPKSGVKAVELRLASGRGATSPIRHSSGAWSEAWHRQLRLRLAVTIGASDIAQIQNGIFMASKRLSQARFEIVDRGALSKLPAGVKPLSPVVRLLPHETRFQKPVLLLLPIMAEIEAGLAKGWRSRPQGWELLESAELDFSVSDFPGLRRDHPGPQRAIAPFWLEHFCEMVAGVPSPPKPRLGLSASVHDEITPPPWPPTATEDVMWPLDKFHRIAVTSLTARLVFFAV